jgi:hypothetical protein
MKKWKAVRENFVRDLKQQRNTTTGQLALKKKRYIFFDQLQFLLPIVGDEKETFSNIPPPESDTVDGAGVSATDVSSVLTVYDYEEEKSNTIENSQSCSGSRTGGKPKGRGKTKDNILLTATKDISKILSESVALQREER